MIKQETYTVLTNRLLEAYHSLGITNEEMMFLIHILSFKQVKEDFPPIQFLQKRMGLSQEETYNLIQSLLDKEMMSIETEQLASGKSSEAYNLEPLYGKLDQLDIQKEQAKKRQEDLKEEGTIFSIVEEEFGRSLSPIEYQQVAAWFSEDNYSLDMVKNAIKEAVLNGKLNLRYIDRILINWRKQNRSGNEREKASYRNAKLRQETTNLPPVPLTKIIKRVDDFKN